MSVVVERPEAILSRYEIPSRRLEGWKYSDLRSVLDHDTFVHSSRLEFGLDDLPSSVERVSRSQIWTPGAKAKFFRSATDSVMDAAARTFPSLALRVPFRSQPVQPIVLKVESCGHGSIWLRVEEGASATLIEDHIAQDNGFRNVSLIVILDQGAALTHIRRASFGAEFVSIETITVSVEKNSSYRAHFFDHGARLSRTELNMLLAGEGADANLSSVSVLGDGAHADLTTHIDHQVGNTTSTQLFKTVAGGKSRGIYQGKITVREGADGSDSRQTAKGLLLGPRAEIDLKPELEIFADDVKCAHGAAVGDLDAESLFYLRSRGIPEAEARALLIRAFLEEAVDGIAQEDIRVRMWEFVEAGLTRAMETAS